MRAIGVTQPGGPEALHEIDVPAQRLRPSQMRIRITAATVNPTDTLTRSAGPPGDAEGDIAGVVPGMDVTGTIREIGPEAETELEVGERVVAIVAPS